MIKGALFETFRKEFNPVCKTFLDEHIELGMCMHITDHQIRITKNNNFSNLIYISVPLLQKEQCQKKTYATKYLCIINILYD